MALTETDRRLMASALRLGRRNQGQTWPNPAVGALLVKSADSKLRIVGRGWTQPGGRPHAETEAIVQAGEDARGADCYVTLEPCSHTGRTGPCADALIAAGIRRCVVAVEDPDTRVAGRGIARLRAAGIEVETGCLAVEAADAHAGHISRVRDHRPHTLLKLAVSADGFAGRTNRGNVAITGQAARARTHRLRSSNDAILVGIGTALADDPSLSCRLPGLEARSPVRVVIDARLQLAPTSKLAASAGDVPFWVIAGKEGREAAASLLELGVRVFEVATRTDGRIDPLVALRRLAEEGITSVMIEGGPALAASFLEADLIDRIELFVSPERIGPQNAVEALPGGSVAGLIEDPRFDRIATETLGSDTAYRLLRKRDG